MSFIPAFSVASVQVASAIEQYSALYPRYRGGSLEGDEQHIFSDVSKALHDLLRLEVITPAPEDADLQAQLVGKDQVHDFGARSVDELKAYRLGTLRSSKTALALINPYGADGRRDILAAIYLYWQQGGIVPMTGFPDLKGHVDAILSEPVAQERSPVTDAVIFYSISTFNSMKGAGQMLISRLHESLNAQLPSAAVFSTLSPLRGFGKWLDAQGLPREGWADDDLRLAALVFLQENRDGVQMFHMGNGAVIGDIKLNANAPGSKDDALGCNVMVNYIYVRSADTVAQHAADYARACAAKAAGDEAQCAGLIRAKMAPHLRDLAAAPPPTFHLPVADVGRHI